jgi:hypothetical protein
MSFLSFFSIAQKPFDLWVRKGFWILIGVSNLWDPTKHSSTSTSKSQAGGLVQKPIMANKGHDRISGQAINQLPPPSDGLVGIQHKLVNHRCALEEWANKRRKYWASVDASSSTDSRAHHRRGEFIFLRFFCNIIFPIERSTSDVCIIVY